LQPHNIAQDNSSTQRIDTKSITNDGMNGIVAFARTDGFFLIGRFYHLEYVVGPMASPQERRQGRKHSIRCNTALHCTALHCEANQSSMQEPQKTFETAIPLFAKLCGWKQEINPLVPRRTLLVSGSTFWCAQPLAPSHCSPRVLLLHGLLSLYTLSRSFRFVGSVSERLLAVRPEGQLFLQEAQILGKS